MKFYYLLLIICLPFIAMGQKQTFEYFDEQGNGNTEEIKVKELVYPTRVNKILFSDERLMPPPIDLSTLRIKQIGPKSNNPNAIKLFIVCDGYTDSALAFSSSTNFYNYFLTVAPMSSYKDRFDCYCVWSRSPEDGVKHPKTATDEANQFPAVPVLNPTNIYGSTMDYGGLHRLLYAPDYQNLNLVWSFVGAKAGCKFVNVGTALYAGSGGGTSFFSGLNSSAFEIGVHEWGHSFVGLCDEYCSNQCNTGPDRINGTTKNTLAETTWANVPGAGMIVGCNYCCSGLWKRPFQSCKMLSLFQPFCKVCSLAAEKAILANSGPIINQPPTVTSHNYTLDLNTQTSISLTANGADTYTWVPFAGLLQSTGQSVVASPTITTSYTITGTSTATGLKDTANCIVKVIPKIIIPTCSPVDIIKVTPVKVSGKNYLDIYVNKVATTTGVTLKFSARQIQNAGFTDKGYTRQNDGAYRISVDASNKLYEVQVKCTEVNCPATLDKMQQTTLP